MKEAAYCELEEKLSCTIGRSVNVNELQSSVYCDFVSCFYSARGITKFILSLCIFNVVLTYSVHQYGLGRQFTFSKSVSVLFAPMQSRQSRNLCAFRQFYTCHEVKLLINCMQHQGWQICF